jgi:hypothetical protein
MKIIKLIIKFFNLALSSPIGFVTFVISTVLFFLALYGVILWYLHTIPERPVFSEYYISSGSEFPERLGGTWMISLPILDNNGNICLVDSTYNCVLIIDNESIFSNIIVIKQRNCILRRKKSIILTHVTQLESASGRGIYCSR